MTTNQSEEPIYGPTEVGPDYIFEPDMVRPVGPSLYLGRKLANAFRLPAHWIKENLIEPNKGPKYYWYHRKYQRAVPIDECFADDYACIYEANMEYRRNLMVDRSTLDILRYRRDSCNFWNLTQKNDMMPSENCDDITKTYNREETNFFIKYGDMHWNHSVVTAYMKQKHRMIVERRRAIKAEKGELPEQLE